MFGYRAGPGLFGRAATFKSPPEDNLVFLIAPQLRVLFLDLGESLLVAFALTFNLAGFFFVAIFELARFLVFLIFKKYAQC